MIKADILKLLCYLLIIELLLRLAFSRSFHDRRKPFFLQLPRHCLCIFPLCECAALYDVVHLLRCVYSVCFAASGILFCVLAIWRVGNPVFEFAPCPACPILIVVNIRRRAYFIYDVIMTQDIFRRNTEFFSQLLYQPYARFLSLFGS